MLGYAWIINIPELLVIRHAVIHIAQTILYKLGFTIGNKERNSLRAYSSIRGLIKSSKNQPLLGFELEIYLIIKNAAAMIVL